MAEGPVSSRVAFVDSNSRYLDFCLVHTNLGPMVEPRPLLVAITAPNGSPDYRLDETPREYRDKRDLDTDSMFTLYGTGGQQAPTDWTP